MISYAGLEKILKEKGIGKTQLSTDVGLSTRTVAKIAKGEKLSRSSLAKIADYLHVVPEFLCHVESDNMILQRLREEKEIHLPGGLYHELQVRMTYNSNHIEGSKLTHDQTRYIFETNTIGTKETVKVWLFVKVLSGFAADVAAETALGDIKLRGYVAERLEGCLKNHLMATDEEYLTDWYKWRQEVSWWHCEFWGKWMHSAAPFAELTGDARLKAKIARGVAAMLAAQEPGGYLGNYPDEKRCGVGGWDVWGMKYTMMGLLHAGDAKSLAAARRLCDYLIAEIGPNGRSGRAVWQTGSWCGMPSSSVLEPVVWPYRRTGEAKYLDFATFIVKGLVEPAEGPRLVDLALKGVRVADRNGHGFKVKENPVPKIHNRLKSYEEMSCYQGMLDYVEEQVKVKGPSRETDDILKAAVMTARSPRTR